MPISNTTALSCTSPAPASDATRLRVLAGTPHSRRGSVLVLVVGVLALLAIIIVVYTSVGQADIRGGRTLVNQARLDDQSHAIRDYIRVIVGNDASATKVQPVSIPTGPQKNLSVHETTDYPYTDPYSRSQLTGNLGTSTDITAARFDAAGNITQQYTGGGLDPRVTSDPFLATIEPTWANRTLGTLPGMPSPFQLMGRQRDWGHMSLISPSGLPVNLANLRGNWTAPSGFSDRPYDPAVANRISDWLYVWPRVSAAAGYMAIPQPTKMLSPINYNSPATWSNDCTETFRPVTWNPDKFHAGDVRFMGNTLGDADGDGFYDSRWQELVDVSDPNRPVQLLPGGTGGGVRWFIAPRIIDLSGMVNVNIATSFAVPPDAENPAGLTPSDVDLERLLATLDARQYFGINPATAFVSGAATYSNNAADITEAGRWAFAGILEGRATGLVEVVDNGYVDAAGPALISPPWLREMGVQRTGGQPAIGSITRKTLYTLGGKDDADGQLRNVTGSTTEFFLKQQSGYGLADELELRTNGFVNDPHLSRLEATAATMATTNRAMALMSPFRSTRDTLIDRDAGISPANTVSSGTPAETLPRSVAQYFGDSRHLVTTLSGARPIGFTLPSTSPLAPGASAARPILDTELRADINTLLQTGLSMTAQGVNTTRRIYPLSAANTIFTNYALALSPFLGSVGAGADSESLWNEADTGNNLRGLAVSFGGVSYDPAITGTNVGETITPLFKGRAAELAVRTAAQMTLNLLAARDDSRLVANSVHPDNRPLAATVLLDDTHRNDVATLTYTGGGRRFPYWQAGSNRLDPADPTALTTFGNRKTDIKAYTFDLNAGQGTTVQRLAGGATTPPMNTRYAVNIFAAQPQPFITAAVTFDMYQDAPLAQGGDSRGADAEWIANPAGPGNVPPASYTSRGITINGTIADSNKDFLMEAVAFQVTNPFDTTITLSEPGGRFAYYFEFGGNFYDARRYEDNGMLSPGAVTLGPRESMCFYVLSQNPADLLTRWRAADPSIDSLASGETVLQAWIKKQLLVLGSSTTTARTVRVDPQTGNPIPSAGIQRVLDNSSTSDDNKVVKLWRVVLDPTSGETVNNTIRQNDYLVDRIHDPAFGNGGRAALYRRLNDGQNLFDAIPAGPEPTDAPYYTGPASQEQNLGYGVTMFGAIRRRTDPTGGPVPGEASDASAGVMPAWCVEAKSRTGLYDAAPNARNITDFNTGFPNPTATGSIQPTDIYGHAWGGRTFREMLSRSLGREYTTAARHPGSRKGTGTAGNGFTDDDVADRIGDDLGRTDGTTVTNRVGWVEGAKPTQLPIYPRRISNTAPLATEVTLPPLRPADLIMPWAIGPYQYADNDPSLNDETRNTTLSEAIAFGLNYSRGVDVKSYEFQIGQVLDRCHLPLDRHVPFNDGGGSPGMWDYNSGNADPSIANGVPFALNIIDRFRTTRYGSIDSVMPGQININTAPLNVLRTLPFLTPVSANVFGNDGAGFTDNWMNSTTGPFALKIKNEAGTITDRSLWTSNEQWDLAATLIAYRDQQAVVARGKQGDEAGGTRRYVDFSRGGKPAIGGATIPGNDGQSFDTAGGKHTGRAFMNNVVNARQELGFGSPAEVLMAVVRDTTARSGQGPTVAEQKRFSMDRFQDNKLNETVGGNYGDQLNLSNFEAQVRPIQNVTAIGLTGTEAARGQALGLTGMPLNRRMPTGTAEHFVQGGKSTDYDRKIAIANALLNTVSTSSDLYCAYFLVNGYTEGDTQGLEPYTAGGSPSEDRYTRAMTPSIQRRFMMVLDRSSCVRAGDMPKVLMFEELPVK